MNLVNCTLDEVAQLAEYHQKEAKIAKQSIPKLVSQHYQHLLYIETKQLQWISIDAKSVPHKKDTFTDFIINCCLHERHWLKHFQREITIELQNRCLNQTFTIMHSLYPKHQRTIDLFMGLILINKWSLLDCWDHIIYLVQRNGLELEKLLHIVRWSNFFHPKSEINLMNEMTKYSEFIHSQDKPFTLKLILTGIWQLSTKDPNVAVSTLKNIKKELDNSAELFLKLDTIDELLKCVQTEILELLKTSSDQSIIFDINNNNIQTWDIFAKELALIFKNAQYDIYKQSLNDAIKTWSLTLSESELYKVYFAQPSIREFIKLPNATSFKSSDQEPWVFDLVNPCRFPYIPGDVRLDGFKQNEETTYQEDSDYPVTTFKDFAQPIVQRKEEVQKQISFSKSMSIERVTQSFQKPSLFKYAKSIFD